MAYCVCLQKKKKPAKQDAEKKLQYAMQRCSCTDSRYLVDSPATSTDADKRTNERECPRNDSVRRSRGGVRHCGDRQCRSHVHPKNRCNLAFEFRCSVR